MSQLCDLEIHVNGQETFFLNQKIASAHSGKLKKIIRQEKRKPQIKNLGIELNEFPGGPDGFELVSRFCYNHGRIEITVSNVSLLHCCALFLNMTEKVSTCSLLRQTESFLDGMFYWSWNDLIRSLKSCESFFDYADSSGLAQKLICSLLAKIEQSCSDTSLISCSSSSSSPETASAFRFSSSTKTTPDDHQFTKKPGSSTKQWWFDELTVLAPTIIEKIIKNIGAYGSDNNSLILTRFLLHYLKKAAQRKGRRRTAGRVLYSKPADYRGLAETCVHGVILAGKSEFSCRGLFWVLRVVSGFGLSKVCRGKLERLIGGMLEQATLDDLLVSGHDKGAYDVNLVLRLMRVFADRSHVASVDKMKSVGRLIDKYLGEISPDPNLKVSKFLAVAESLPDSARSCFDRVYRAIDIYLESHPSLSFEERSRLCRCLNYEKLSLETSKELAKNPSIPPIIAVQALLSQTKNSKIPKNEFGFISGESATPAPQANMDTVLMCNNNFKTTDVDVNMEYVDVESLFHEKEEVKTNIERMQLRVIELEKACTQMEGQISRLVRHHNVIISTPFHNNRALPRLC